jgi:biopolymer transport protein TolQ
MNHAQDLSIFSLAFDASLLAKAVMLLLLVVSLISWTFIFKKWFVLRHTQTQIENFERSFWSGNTTLQTLYQNATKRRHQTGALEHIFETGMSEFLKIGEKFSDTRLRLDGARRAMRAAFLREIEKLEAHLTFLGSAGSVSPYVGLFGTVWGIMNAFRGLSNMQQATLANVAPGIAEALIATAIGLFAAIPAVMAYNLYSREIDGLANRFENFIEEFLNILQRQSQELTDLSATSHLSNSGGHHG